MRSRFLAAALLLASACGAGGGDASDQRATGEPTGAATEEGPAADCVETTDVLAVDNDFEPICVIASAGTELSVTNEGGSPHTFTIPDTNVDEVLEPGDETTVTVPDTLETNAESEFQCRFHPSMVGYLYVAGP
jgi:plastocyanin